MSRIRSVAAAATNPDRRAFLAATGAVGLAAGVGFALRPETDAHAATAADQAAATEVPLANLSNRAAPAAPLAPYTRGTTLASVATPRGASGYRRLGGRPGLGAGRTRRPGDPQVRP